MFCRSRNSFVGSLLIGFALLGVTGCKETVSSGDIRTGAIALDTMVTANGSSSKLRVTMRVAGGSSNVYVELQAGDELLALADGDEKELEQVSDGVFEATFDTAEEDTEFEVHLLRDDDEDATDNRGTLPAPFMITSDLGDDPISRMDDVEVTWSPSGTDDDMLLAAEDEAGDHCIVASEDFNPSGDRGVFVIEASDEHFGDDEEETCDITLDVIREREGVRDGNLDRSSTFFLRQVRSTTFLSGP